MELEYWLGGQLNWVSESPDRKKGYDEPLTLMMHSPAYNNYKDNNDCGVLTPQRQQSKRLFFQDHGAVRGMEIAVSTPAEFDAISDYSCLSDFTPVSLSKFAEDVANLPQTRDHWEFQNEMSEDCLSFEGVTETKDGMKSVHRSHNELDVKVEDLHEHGPVNVYHHEEGQNQACHSNYGLLNESKDVDMIVNDVGLFPSMQLQQMLKGHEEPFLEEEMDDCMSEHTRHSDFDCDEPPEHHEMYACDDRLYEPKTQMKFLRNSGNHAGVINEKSVSTPEGSMGKPAKCLRRKKDNLQLDIPINSKDNIAVRRVAKGTAPVAELDRTLLFEACEPLLAQLHQNRTSALQSNDITSPSKNSITQDLISFQVDSPPLKPPMKRKISILDSDGEVMAVATTAAVANASMYRPKAAKNALSLSSSTFTSSSSISSSLSSSSSEGSSYATKKTKHCRNTISPPSRPSILAIETKQKYCFNCRKTETTKWFKIEGRRHCHDCTEYYNKHKRPMPPHLFRDLDRNAVQNQISTHGEKNAFCDECDTKLSDLLVLGRSGRHLCGSCFSYRKKHNGRNLLLNGTRSTTAKSAGRKSVSQSSSEAKKMNFSEDRVCLNCGTRETCSWRRGKEGEQLCCPCSQYEEIHGVPRPMELEWKLRQKRVPDAFKICDNCDAKTSLTAWYRTKKGGYLCGPCKTYELKHGIRRPLFLQRKLEEKRKKLGVRCLFV
jgi:hypothetical protein